MTNPPNAPDGPEERPLDDPAVQPTDDPEVQPTESVDVQRTAGPEVQPTDDPAAAQSTAGLGEELSADRGRIDTAGIETPGPASYGPPTGGPAGYQAPPSGPASAPETPRPPDPAGTAPWGAPPTGAPDPAAAAPWGAPPPPPPRADQPGYSGSRLRRSVDDRVLAGVCGGLGRQTGVDPLLFRIGFVALVFAAGTGVVLYALLALLMPSEARGAGWAGVSGRSFRPRAAPAGVPGPDGSQVPAGMYGPDGSYAPGPYEPGPAPPPPGPRSPVAAVTLAVLLIGLGVVVLGARYLDWSFDPSAIFGVGVALVGIALLVSAFGPWRGGKGGLTVLGIMLVLGLGVTSIVDQRSGFTDGNFASSAVYAPSEAGELRPAYQVTMGESTLDLRSALGPDVDPTSVAIDVTMGSFEVIVPSETDVSVQTDVTFGSVRVFGSQNDAGGYYPGSGGDPESSDQRAALVLDVDVAFGDLAVTRLR